MNGDEIKREIIDRIGVKSYREILKELLIQVWASAEFGLYESTTKEELVESLKDTYSYFENSYLSEEDKKEVQEVLESRGL